jgi:hypothetical protein
MENVAERPKKFGLLMYLVISKKYRRTLGRKTYTYTGYCLSALVLYFGYNTHCKRLMTNSILPLSPSIRFSFTRSS